MVTYACLLGSITYVWKITSLECYSIALHYSFKRQHHSMYDCSAHKQIRSAHWRPGGAGGGELQTAAAYLLTTVHCYPIRLDSKGE
jgi:hypothetical protein